MWNNFEIGPMVQEKMSFKDISYLELWWLRLLSILRGGSVVVDFLFIVTPIVGVCNCSMFCCTLLYVHSSIAIILMGKRELVALLYLSSWCLVMVEQLFFVVPRGCLRFVIVVFPDHTDLLFFKTRGHLKIFLSVDLAALLFRGAKPFVQFW